MSTKKAAPKTKPLGPRGLGSDVRGQLLQAGRELYAEKGLESVSLREVAERADANQAMVRYYFTDKHGFETALLEDSFERFVAAIEAEDEFQSLIQTAVKQLSAMPWLPILMTRTVYVSDSLRGQYMEKFAPRITANLQRVLALPKGMPPALTFMSIISLLVFPQLARPVMAPVLGVTFDDKFAAEFAAYAGHLFQQKSPKE